MKRKTAKKNGAARKSPPRKSAARKANGRASASGTDAIALLTKDHKLVKSIFRKHKSLVKNNGSRAEKLALVKEACEALAAHALIEEEIFYPSIRGAVDRELLAEAFVEHDGAKELIEQLQDMSSGDALFDAKFIVLGEQVKHHIEEEETKIFPKLKRAGLDLEALGREMKEMKDSLERGSPFPDLYIPREREPVYVT
jgi:hemerythrin superfamily protein